MFYFSAKTALQIRLVTQGLLLLLLQISYQREVSVGCIELQVDEFVDVSLSLRVEVLFDHRLHF